MSRITIASGVGAQRSDRVARVGSRALPITSSSPSRGSSLLELVTVVVAAHLASPWGIRRSVLLHTVLGAALVAASAGAFNQWWEQSTDAPMVRTATGRCRRAGLRRAGNSFRRRDAR